MTIFDVVLNTDDLVVLGPPDVVDLSVSVGQQGQRGATFYAGSGNPNDTIVSENIFTENVVPFAGDIFINTAVGPQYGWLYIYNPKVVGNQWDQVLRLQSPNFALSYERIFDDGEATVSVPLASILPPGVSQSNPDNYIVFVSSISANPTVINVKTKTVNPPNLDIVLTGIEYSSGSWAALDAEAEFSINISIA